MRLVCVLLSLILSFAAEATVRITAPPFDSVTTSRTITVRGTADAGDGNTIKVTAAGVTHTATVAGGTWQVTGVRLANGFNKVRARAPGSGSNTFVAISFASLVDRGEQRGTIVWGVGTTEMLKDIARNTLDPDPSAAELDTFVTEVKARVAIVVERAYANVANVRFVGSTGAGVQEILIRKDYVRRQFGISHSDCGNVNPKQSLPSRVNLGTYAASWKSLSRWRPMRQGDTLEMRIQDVAEAIGRTGAHEFGHSLGLVVCGWMHGCASGHNCPQFDRDNPPVDRFNNGFHIMDGGLDTFNWARIAEPVSATRTTPRTPAFFNVLNRSYLGIIHPLP